LNKAANLLRQMESQLSLRSQLSLQTSLVPPSQHHPTQSNIPVNSKQASI
jgi:hypothetical protein